MVGFAKNDIQCFKILAGAELKPVFGELETRLKFNKFGLWLGAQKNWFFQTFN